MMIEVEAQYHPLDTQLTILMYFDDFFKNIKNDHLSSKILMTPIQLWFLLPHRFFMKLSRCLCETLHRCTARRKESAVGIFNKKFLEAPKSLPSLAFYTDRKFIYYLIETLFQTGNCR